MFVRHWFRGIESFKSITYLNDASNYNIALLMIENNQGDEKDIEQSYIAKTKACLPHIFSCDCRFWCIKYVVDQGGF